MKKDEMASKPLWKQVRLHSCKKFNRHYIVILELSNIIYQEVPETCVYAICNKKKL